MKDYANNQITLLQYIFIITGLQVNVSIVSLPRNLAETAGTDGWMSIIIGWVISAAASIAIIRVMKNHPEGTLLDLLTRFMGMWAGKVISLLLSLYYFYILYDGLTRTILITKAWLLPTIPNFILMILLLIPTYAIAQHGPSVLGRYAELIAYMSLWIPFVYILTLKNAHWLHLLPMFKDGWQPILSAVKETIYPSLGMAATFILYPFLKHKEKAATGILISTSLSMVVYLFFTVICFLYYSPDDISNYNDVVISVLKSIEFKFVERIEVIFIAYHLFLYSLVWIPTMYLTTYCTSWLFRQSDHRGHMTWLCVLLAIGTIIYSPTFNQSDRLENLLTWIGFGTEYVFPVCLAVYLWIRKSSKRRPAHEGKA
ncbi:GerAB/ArcD/ProY family transporter [Cohnella silvisoli]|uniref:Endospore germination permease n=1 Tax=Cohnella silvisoli TaxID=2873699 RepID=A0ABV1KZS9_9BACL|nr:endospore germination permease [Cohnella silvisoli]MCD9024964.1 spore germination protein [Cohnella silvisoli]